VTVVATSCLLGVSTRRMERLVAKDRHHQHVLSASANCLMRARTVALTG
jgi:hypothetical protein